MEIPFMYLLCKIDYMDGCVSFTSNGENLYLVMVTT